MENIRERIVSCAGRVWFCAKELLKWLALAMITGVPCGIIGAENKFIIPCYGKSRLDRF